MRIYLYHNIRCGVSLLWVNDGEIVWPTLNPVCSVVNMSVDSLEGTQVHADEPRESCCYCVLMFDQNGPSLHGLQLQLP